MCLALLELNITEQGRDAEGVIDRLRLFWESDSPRLGEDANTTAVRIAATIFKYCFVKQETKVQDRLLDKQCPSLNPR
jgi:hypothetical protein